MKQQAVPETQPPVVRRLVDKFLARSPMRTTSLIITLFGDMVSQHGNTIWLGSLVTALAPLGLNERLVRTSVFRLVQEGWLEAERVGRRSYYRFTAHGTSEYERAARRIYATEDTSWEGHWQLLVPVNLPEKDRENFRRSLSWQGFRSICAGTFAKPGRGGRALREALEEFDAADKVLLFDASSSELAGAQALRDTVHECWQLNATATAYREFLATYKPLLKWLDKHGSLPPEAAFIARTLLIHDYRRVLLHDTPLPAELLPPAWPGAEAQALTGRAYKALAAESIRYITGILQTGSGAMPAATAGFRGRFPNITT